MVHAQLDANNVCTGYGDLTNIETAPNLVYLPDGWDEDLLWRKYEGGAWSAEKFEPSPPPYQKPVSEEIAELKAENAALNQQLAQTNADAVAFQEFIFANFPELA